MTNLLSSKKRDKALRLRIEGYSLSQISKKLYISKSTASLLLRNIQLNKQAKKVLQKTIDAARAKAFATRQSKRQSSLMEIDSNAELALQKVNLKNGNLCKIFCSLLYWGEGGKIDNHVSFINSDAKMIKTFLSMLRKAFNLDENKFRALIHIHEYHDEKAIKYYWSKITKIQLSQFTKSYLKSHTGISIHPNYKGTIKIKYYDNKIAYELKAIYNRIADEIGM